MFRHHRKRATLLLILATCYWQASAKNKQKEAGKKRGLLAHVNVAIVIAIVIVVVAVVVVSASKKKFVSKIN